MKTVSVLCAVLMIFLAGCGGRKAAGSSASPDGRIASPIVPLGSPFIGTLGKLQGPYKLDKVLSPCVVQLTPAQGDPEKFTLLGILDGNYPKPPDPNDKRPEQEKKAEAKAFYEKFAKYKVDALGSLLKDKVLYILPMGTTDAPPVYLFSTSREIKDKSAPNIDGQLINAQVLRDGIANMDLDEPAHSFRELMLECQVAAVVDARRAVKNKETTNSIWIAFPVRMPADYDPQIEDMDKKL